MILFYKIHNASLNKSFALFVFITLYLFNSTLYSAISKEDTLAVIENKVITSAEFISLYKEKITRIGLTDNGETRLGYLINLVNDELLIAEAKNKGLDKTEAAKKEYKRICFQKLLNAHSLNYISPAVNINENEFLQQKID